MEDDSICIADRYYGVFFATSNADTVEYELSLKMPQTIGNTFDRHANNDSLWRYLGVPMPPNNSFSLKHHKEIIPVVDDAQYNSNLPDTASGCDFPIRLIANNSQMGQIYWGNGSTDLEREIHQDGWYYLWFQSFCDSNHIILDSVFVYKEDCYFELQIPNVFTPNGDGKNDLYYLLNKGVVEFYLVVYNRWGQMVFETNDVNDSWDGTFEGKPCSEGAYYYHVKARGRFESQHVDERGYLNLYR